MIILGRERISETIFSNGIWMISNLCRGIPPPNFEKVKIVLDLLTMVLGSSESTPLISDAAWALSYLSNGTKEQVEWLCKNGAIPKLLKCIR